MKLTPKFISRFCKNYRKRINAVYPYKQRRIPRSHVKISAYISIYNDGDFISTVLENIKNYVDELVVVDGAYEWMVPYLGQLGIDPTRSKEEIYDAINASGIPYRVLNKIWKNELEKRKSGYEQCSHRYVMRIDADEVMFFNDEFLEGFIGSGCAVAEMQCPLYLTPGWVIGTGKASGFRYPTVCLIFDSSRIPANKHLDYLWLVIPAENLSDHNSRTYPIYEKPVAFCAHLSVWRSADTAANRAAFYISNWIRKHGVPWLHQTPDAKKIEFSDIFNFIPADEFRSAIQRSHVAFGVTRLAQNEVVVPSPLSVAQERQFLHHYHTHIAELSELNKKATETAQTYILGEFIYMDVTDNSTQHAVSSSNEIRVRIRPDVRVRSSLVMIKNRAPFIVREDLPCNIEGDIATFNISPRAEQDDTLRQFIELKISGSGEVYGHFQVMVSAGDDVPRLE